MSQFQKILDVLDLFTGQRKTLVAEEVADLLGVSRPTAFRYLRQLSDSGMVVRISGRYALGARIIELDYRSRLFDPILLASRDVLTRLTAEVRCSAMVSVIYADQIVNIHQDSHVAAASNSFGRGRVLPLFRGAASKAILSHLPAPRLKRLFEAHAADPDALAIASQWPAFQRYFRDIRKDGYYFSEGEVDPDVAGISAPIFNEGLAVGAVTSLHDLPHAHLLDGGKIGQIVKRYAGEISKALDARADIARPATC